MTILGKIFIAFLLRRSYVYYIIGLFLFRDEQKYLKFAKERKKKEREGKLEFLQKVELTFPAPFSPMYPLKSTTICL